MTRRCRQLREERGTAAVEFALTFALLWTLLTGCFRVGYSIYTYENLVSAVAAAARYAAHVDFDEPDHTFVGRICNMAVYGSPTGGGTPVAPSLTTGQIQVTWTRDAAGVPLTLTVSIRNYSIDALFHTFTWTGKPVTTVRFAGLYKS
jgi:Flp pilus assembly protein TadG